MQTETYTPAGTSFFSFPAQRESTLAGEILAALAFAKEDPTPYPLNLDDFRWMWCAEDGYIPV